MKQNEIDNLLKKIKNDYKVFGPVKKNGQSYIERINEPKAVDYSGDIPLDPWKFLFFPVQETLLDENFKEPKANYPKICAWA
jgi:hypothetical protein